MDNDPGKKLRILMAEKNINTSELAMLTNLSCATISNLRNNRVIKPNIETARLISEALNVKINDIWDHLRY